MQTSLKNGAIRSGLRVLAFAGLASLISVGAASAQQASPYQTRARDYYGLYQQNQGGYSSQDQFDRSGSVGRDGLGASPYHPEGPGNPRG